ncbi:TonB-dependent receptor plug domain-containing protein [Aquimarina hainanensis]|uniref:TonB-dependent receptor plug domain-containing protein n=1 Tax=Aquimarina hainanensis TaxID=1578017 RepID=A0ABW5N9S7_9FLAO
MNTLKKKAFYSIALCVLGTSVVISQESGEEKVTTLDEVVISDSKFELKRIHSGKVITKISSKELENSKGQSVATVLNRVAGVEINGNRSAGGRVLGYYIRGGRNRQVIVRIDGVTVSDPSTISGEFDLRLLSTQSIKEIEILKGASSTLYGSGAATAVINITTKSASKKSISVNFDSSIGTNQSQEDQEYDVAEFINRASVNGTVGKVSYIASFSNRFSDGISAAEKLPEDTSESTFDKDAYSRFNVASKIGYQWNDRFKFHVFGNLDQFKNAYDAGGAADAANNSFSRQLRGGSHWEYQYANGNIVAESNYSLFRRSFASGSGYRISDSRSFTFDVYNKYTFADDLHTVLGINGANNDYEAFQGANEFSELTQIINDEAADFDILDPYVNLVYTSPFGMTINAGARLNIHSEYGTHLVYSINPSYAYAIGEENTIKALASYSTAYITPTLFQLFSPSYGNRELKPEENNTIEAGLEWAKKKNMRVSVVYFNRKEKEFVDFVDTGNFVFQYQNVADSFNTQGVEVEVLTRILKDQLTMTGNFTYTDLDDEISQTRIPEIKFNVGVGYQISPKTYSNISYQFNGRREDNFFNLATFASEPRTLSSYGVLDAAINHQLLDVMTVYASVDNILNEEYQEIYGFSTLGRNVRIGMNLKF